MVEELLDVCDENNNLLGISKLKSEVGSKGLWHRSAHIWIYNSKGELLMQFRGKHKKLFPSTWDISAAGHVIAGETPIVAALRETEEEIGLKLKEEDLEFYKIQRTDIEFGEIVNRNYGYAYLFKYDGDIANLKIQKEELDKIKFFKTGILRKKIENKSPDVAQDTDYLMEIIEEVEKRTN